MAEEGKPFDEKPELYEMNSMTRILSWCERTGRSYWEYVQECEDHDIWDYLAEVWSTMREAIERGLDQEGVLPGPLNSLLFCKWYNTAGTTPQDPQVGAVTIRPPDAFSSLTANA